MENIKFKLQAMRGKVKKLQVRVKLWVRRKLASVEYKMGLPARCSMCTERIFCETYSNKPYKKSVLHPDRCTNNYSTR